MKWKQEAYKAIRAANNFRAILQSGGSENDLSEETRKWIEWIDGWGDLSFKKTKSGEVQLGDWGNRPGRHHPTERDNNILALRHEGLTLTQIGARYGITKERVRQILWKLGASGRLPSLPKAQPVAPRSFKKTIFRWLIELGYQYCSKCCLVKPLGDFMPKHQKKAGISCRSCCSARMRIRYHESDKIRQYLLTYQRNHRDKCKEYARKYQTKKHEERKQKGLCVQCENPVDTGIYRCSICKEKNAARSREQYALRKKLQGQGPTPK